MNTEYFCPKIMQRFFKTIRFFLDLESSRTPTDMLCSNVQMLEEKFEKQRIEFRHTLVKFNKF